MNTNIIKNSELLLFTVVVPARNSSEYIEKCLSSIKAASQTYSIELIVINDSSTDDTSSKARLFTDKVVTINKSSNRLLVRLTGFELAKGSIIVNIDSDVIIPANTFDILLSYFKDNPELKGVSGMLSSDSGHPGFFSVYKHLYMNYIYNQTPKNVSFLYGSLFAFRNDPLIIAHLEKLSNNMHSTVTDDTEAGLSLSKKGYLLHLAHDIQLKHLKAFSFLSLLKNDFQVPKDFGKLCWIYGSPGAVLKDGGNFTHTSYRQVISLLLAAITLILLITNPSLSVLTFFFWFLLNLNFIIFLGRHQGIFWAARATPIIFIDNIVMFLGTIVGLASGLCGKK